MLAARDKISIRQAVILFLMLVYSPSIRIFPTTAAKTAERAGWLAPILSILPFVCLVFIMQALFRKEKEASLSDIFFKVLGKIPGTVLLTLYLIWVMIVLGIYVRYFAERFLTSLLPNTPMNFFTVTILAVVFYAVRGGIIYVTRTVEFLFLVFSVVLVVLFLFTMPNFEVINLFPVTHYDLWPVTRSTYSILGIWAYFTFIFFFGDKINDKEHIRRFGLQGTVYLAITALMILIQTIGVYGYSVVERLSMPYFFVTKSISILETIERIESVAIAFWVMVDFVIISVFLYITVSLIKSLFALTEAKALVSPITIFAFIFAQYIAQNRFELENFSNFIGLIANIILGFVFPFIVFIMGKVRGKI